MDTNNNEYSRFREIDPDLELDSYDLIHQIRHQKVKSLL